MLLSLEVAIMITKEDFFFASSHFGWCKDGSRRENGRNRTEVNLPIPCFS